MCGKMRIKAVLRDSDILKMDPASANRIKACAIKNLERIVSWTSLLKVMGLSFDERTKMLEVLSTEKIHLWLGVVGDQHVIYLSENENEELEFETYQWQ
jgi:hypothetical protein